MVSYSSLCIYWDWPKKLHKLQIAVILISSFVINLAVGTLYTFGNIQPYLVSYIRHRSHPSDLRFTQSTYIYSCQVSLFSVGFIVGSFVEKSLGPRVSTLIGGSMTGIGLCLSAAAIKYSFWLLMLTFGIFYSFGLGMLYAISVVCVIKWLPKWAGISTGIVISGNGFSIFAFAAFQTGLINPSNKSPDDAPYADNPDEMYFSQDELLDKVPYTLLIEGIVFLVMLPFVGIFMVLPSPVATDPEAFTEIELNSTVKKIAVKDGLSPSQIMKRFDFYLLWSISAINITSFGVILSLYKTYGLEVVKASDYFLTIVGIVAGIAGIIGRICFGLLADRIDHKFAFILQSALMAIFLLSLYVTSLKLSVMYLIWISGIFLCYGGYLTMFGVAVLKCFGEKYLNANYAILYTNPIVGSIISGIISDYCVDFLEWHGTFILLGVLSGIQLIFSILLTNHKTIATVKKYTLEFHDVIDLLETHVN